MPVALLRCGQSVRPQNTVGVRSPVLLQRYGEFQCGAEEMCRVLAATTPTPISPLSCSLITLSAVYSLMLTATDHDRRSGHTGGDQNSFASKGEPVEFVASCLMNVMSAVLGCH